MLTTAMVMTAVYGSFNHYCTKMWRHKQIQCERNYNGYIFILFDKGLADLAFLPYGTLW